VQITKRETYIHEPVVSDIIRVFRNMFSDGVLDIVVSHAINFLLELASRVDQESRDDRKIKVLSQLSRKEFFIALPETESNLWVVVIIPKGLVIRDDSFTRTAPVQMAVYESKWTIGRFCDFQELLLRCDLVNELFLLWWH
tara:strand:- start:73 stop:495 length:423 start_codon:yes stop_codon:yes gene_type:complete